MTMKNLVPMLNVADISKSLAFYRNLLGFELVSPEEALKEWNWCSLRAGKAEIMLSESQCPPELPRLNPQKSDQWPAIFYFYPEDVRALYQQVLDQGITPSAPLETTFYGMTEFSLQDPDGHLLSFGQDAEN